MTETTTRLRAVLLAALMVLSVVAVATPASADVTSADRDIGSTSVAPGATVTITDTVQVDSSHDFALNEDFSPNVSSAQVQSVEVGSDTIADPAINESDASGISVAVNDSNIAQGGETITVTYQVTMPSSSGDYTISGEAISSNTETIAGEDTITVGSSTAGGSDHRAANPDGTGEAPTDGTSTVYVFPGATVYKGEEDLSFESPLEDTLTGVSGNAEGTILSDPIPQEQSEGYYTNDGDSEGTTYGVTVNTPRVTELDILNRNDADIAGGSVSESTANDLEIAADWNFGEAEDLELTVEDSSGLEITDDVVDDSADRSGGSATWNLDLSEQDAGEYTITVEGTEDLDFGPATQTTTLSLNTQDDVEIDLDSSSVTQGENVRYTIRGAIAGDTHNVTIDANDLRDSTSLDGAARVFRNVGDVEERGVLTEDGDVYAPGDVPSDATIDYLYAEVEIDDDTGVGVGSIDTQYLDDTSVDVDVYDADANASDIADGIVTEADSQTLDITEGEVSIGNPRGTYVVGSEVEVNGTAPSGLDEVALYARDQGEYELLDLNEDDQYNSEDTVSVDSDGTWSQEDVTLSEASDIFSITGTYRLGVIDAQDAGGANNLSEELSTSDFNSGTSGQVSLRVTETSLDATFWTVNGQVAQETGTIDVNGTAPGADRVLVGFIGRRGSVSLTTTSVDSDDYTFEEDDIPVSSLAQGEVHGFAYHIGQDGVAGDGEVPTQDNAEIGNLVTWLEEEQDQRDGTQVWNAFEAETVEDTASDDNLVSTQFRLADASTRINTVYTEGYEASGINPIAVGETAMVMGQTNLQPEDNTITLELVNQGGDTVALTSTEDWSWDGSWSVEMPVGDDVETGNYTLEADDGENTDTVDVQIVNASALETTTSTEETSTTSTTSTSTTTTSMEETSTTTTTTSTEETTSGSSPGFGVALALIALAGAALLALRREH